MLHLLLLLLLPCFHRDSIDLYLRLRFRFRFRTVHMIVSLGVCKNKLCSGQRPSSHNLSISFYHFYFVITGGVMGAAGRNVRRTEISITARISMTLFPFKDKYSLLFFSFFRYAVLYRRLWWLCKTGLISLKKTNDKIEQYLNDGYDLLLLKNRMKCYIGQANSDSILSFK